MSWTSCRSIRGLLTEHHYLGPINRGVAWQDEFGAIVVAPPTARCVPQHWLELSRWCLVSKELNAGSRQWSAFVRDLRKANKGATTIISYSDPAAGHTGALYRACNWWWAPTWLRLRPPPSKGGQWANGRVQSIKDRWVFALRRDRERVALLTAQDESILRRCPWLRYTEPGGVPYKQYAVGPLDERLPSRASLVQPEATAPLSHTSAMSSER